MAAGRKKKARDLLEMLLTLTDDEWIVMANNPEKVKEFLRGLAVKDGRDCDDGRDVWRSSKPDVYDLVP